jgi:hypothetical protein
MRILALLIILLPSISNGQVPPNPKKADSVLVADILFRVLDTLTVRPDSSAFSNPYHELPDFIKSHLLSRVLSEGYSFQPVSAYFKGILDAIVDLRKCHFKRKDYGLERIVTLQDGTSWEVSLVQEWILHTRYGIALDRIGGDQVNPWQLNYAKGYNLVSKSVLDRYFGEDVLQWASDQLANVIKHSGASHPEWRRNP